MKKRLLSMREAASFAIDAMFAAEIGEELKKSKQERMIELSENDVIEIVIDEPDPINITKTIRSRLERNMVRFITIGQWNGKIFIYVRDKNWIDPIKEFLYDNELKYVKFERL